MVATAHGTSLRQLVENPVRKELVGGKQRMAIGDRLARSVYMLQQNREFWLVLYNVPETSETEEEDDAEVAALVWETQTSYVTHCVLVILWVLFTHVTSVYYLYLSFIV